MSGRGMSARVLKAMSVFGGVQVLGVLCSVVRMKFVALWLGPAGVGLFGIYNGAADMLRTLSQLGFRDSSVRDIVAHRGSVAALGEIVTIVRRWGWILGIVGAVIMAGAAPLLSLKTFGSYGHTLSFMVLAIVLFLGALTSAEQVIMQGTEHLRQLASASLWGTVAGLCVSIPMFYFWRLDSVIPSIIAYAAAMCVAVVCYRVRGLRVPSPVSMGETLRRGRRFIVLGIYMTSADFISQLVSYIFISWLNVSAGDEAVGFYQAGYTMVNRYVGLVLSAMVMEYYPRLTSAITSALRVRVYVAHEALMLMLVLLPAATLFISLAPWVVRLLYASDFVAVVPFVTIAMVGVIFRAISYCMAYVILAKGDGITYLTTESLSSACALALNICAYKLWGLAGLGVSYAVWYLAYLIIVSVVYCRRYGFRIPASMLTLGLGAVCLICLCAWTALRFSPLVVLPVAIIVSVLSLRRLVGLLKSR